MAELELRPNWVHANVPSRSPAWVNEKLIDLRLQSYAVVEYVAALPKVHFERRIRKTDLDDTGPVSSVLRPSKAGKPFLGCFAGRSCDPRHTYVATYPGWLLTTSEIDEFQDTMQVHTVLDSILIPASKMFKFGCSEVCLVGDPMAPGCNTNCEGFNIPESMINCELMRDMTDKIDCISIEGGVPRLTDQAGYIAGIDKAIEAGKELVLPRYKHDWFDPGSHVTDVDYCSWCWKVSKEELIHCTKPECERRFHKTAACHGTSTSEGWLCHHHDGSTIDYPDSKRFSQGQVLSTEPKPKLKAKRRKREEEEEEEEEEAEEDKLSRLRSQEIKAKAKASAKRHRPTAEIMSGLAAYAEVEKAPVNRGGRPAKGPPPAKPAAPHSAENELRMWSGLKDRMQSAIATGYRVNERTNALLSNPGKWIVMDFRYEEEAAAAAARSLPDLDPVRFVEWLNYHGNFTVARLVRIGGNRWRILGNWSRNQAQSSAPEHSEAMMAEMQQHEQSQKKKIKRYIFDLDDE